MFDTLTEKLQNAFKSLRKTGKLSEKNIEQVIKEVRNALLSADVHYKVVKEFLKGVKVRALGTEVMKAWTPAEQFINIVHEELTTLLTADEGKGFSLSFKPPVAMMVVGLQGSGKTTTSAKLARLLKSQKRNPLLVPLDVYRPAAIKQLQVLAAQVSVKVWETPLGEDTVSIAQKAMEYARMHGYDTVILDTAGRLHTDEDMMEELHELTTSIQPHHTLFVADAMTGQDAVRVAEQFHKVLPLTGVILTKLDGDAQGGAALSIRAVTGVPIVWIGKGEKMQDLEPFHPERMASRILRGGHWDDVLDHIKQVPLPKEPMDPRQLKQLNFTQLLQQLRMVQKLGPIGRFLDKIPGMKSHLKKLEDQGDLDKSMGQFQAMIYAMTPEERDNPKLLNASRKVRIAKGSGTTVQEVNRLLQQLAMMNKMLKSKKKRFGLF